MSWIDEFENKLRQSLAENSRNENNTQSAPVSTGGQAEVKSKPAKKYNSLNLFLFVLILVVFVVIAFQFRKDKLQDKNNAWNNSWNSWERVQPKDPEIEQPQLDIEDIVMSIQKELDEMRQKCESLGKDNDLYQKRMTLLAIIHNNNTCVLRNNYSKRDLIYLNTDWTINEIPKHIEFNKDDKEFIKQFVR